MRVFLLWQRTPEDPPPEVVAALLQELVAPVLHAPPDVRILTGAATTLVSLELPVNGWKPSPFQEDERLWVLAPDYPLGAESALATRGILASDENVLPVLCRALQDDPAPLVRELAPPFSLIWCEKASGMSHVQNDGLGQAQLFEYRDERRWALTNRVLALQALGIPVVIEPHEWAVRATLGWFPMQSTGYRGIRFLEPAVQLALDGGRVRRMSVDVLGDWLDPGRLSREDCLELARHSLVRQTEAAKPLWDRPSVGLSGGWDTRAVVAVLRSLGVQFRARVRAKPGRHDAAIASELARLGGFDIHVQPDAVAPLGGTAGYRRSIALALRWQAGYMETAKHRSFLANGKPLRRVVNIMGQHGEIGRAYYAKRFSGLEDNQAEERLVAWLESRAPPFIHPRLLSHVRETIREAFRQANAYGLTGPARLDFFYLYERTRRWASGSLSSQTSFVFAPFLNPDYIRAVFAYPGADKENNPFHRHIVATHASAWTNVPYERDLRGRDLNSQEAMESAWATVAEPVVREALDEAGTWTEIFSPDSVAARWKSAPDQVVMAHLLDDTMRAHDWKWPARTRPTPEAAGGVLLS
jgi:hypothetical protein